MSRIVTFAPSPAAIFAAFVPTTPPPRITTLPGATPGTPPSRMPRPPCSFSRYLAPSCTAMRPATSDIGVRSGSSPDGNCTVSYAMHVAPLFMHAFVSFSSAAKWKYVKIVWPLRIRGHSGAIGSLTFMMMSAAFHTASASGAMRAPAFTYRSSQKPLPSPAPFSMCTVWPAATSASAPAGTSATRFSLVLISFGTPMFMLSRNGQKLRRLRSLGGSRTEAHDGLRRRREVFAAHGRDVLGGNRINCGKDFIERLVRLIVQRHARSTIHSRRHTFQRERDLPLELALPAAQLLLGQPFVREARQLVSNRLGRTAGGLGRRADVHAVHARLRVERVEGVHRVGEPQLLADALEEARAHPSPEHRAREHQGVTARIAVRHRGRAEHDVCLRRVALHVSIRRSRGRGRGNHERGAAGRHPGP